MYLLNVLQTSVPGFSKIMLATEANDAETAPSPESVLLQRNDVAKHIEPKRSCCEHFKYVLKNITVEPTLTLLVMAWIITNFSTQNLILEKACRVKLNFSSEICDELRTQDEYGGNPWEREVQLVVARFIPYKTYIVATVSSFLTLLAGCYSDKTGQRKFFILVAIVAQMILCTNNILNNHFFYELGLEVLVFSEALIEGFSGTVSLPTFIIITYIAAITTEKNRTFRMGMLNFSLSIGFPVGMALSGIMINQFGFYGSFGLALAIHGVNFFYTTLFVTDPPKTIEQETNSYKGAGYKFRTFFNIFNILESFRVMFRSGANYRRLRMFINTLVSALFYGLVAGEAALLYLMVRYRFSWDELQFSIYQTYSFITQTSGTIFVISVFSRLLGWHDSLLGIITCISKMAAAFVYCFAPTGSIFFLGPFVEALSTSVLPMRSLITKMVKTEELGQVMSIVLLAENLAPLGIIPLYSTVYAATISTLPGAVYLIAAGIAFPTTFVFSYLFYENRKGLRQSEKEVLEDAEEIPMRPH